MYISGSDTVSLSFEEFRSVVNGKFKVFKCTSCFGKGWYWVHEDGTMRDPLPSESEDDFYKHPCTDNDECGGLGFHVKVDEDE